MAAAITLISSRACRQLWSIRAEGWYNPLVSDVKSMFLKFGSRGEYLYVLKLELLIARKRPHFETADRS